MQLKDIAPYVSKAAPLLGSIIGGPVGAATAVAADLLAKAFGADPAHPEELLNTIIKDPERDLKLAQIESENLKTLATFHLQMTQAEVEREQNQMNDVQNARSVFTNNLCSVNVWLGVVVVIAFISIFFGVFVFDINPFEKELVMQSLPGLLALVGAAGVFLFGWYKR